MIFGVYDKIDWSHNLLDAIKLAFLSGNRNSRPRICEELASLVAVVLWFVAHTFAMGEGRYLHLLAVEIEQRIVLGRGPVLEKVYLGAAKGIVGLSHDLSRIDRNRSDPIV